jgi:long-chain acyl-CoA synthetase
VGNGRPFIAALVVLDPDVASAWCRDRGLYAAAAASEPQVAEAIQNHIDLVNARFAGPERVRAFRIVSDDWFPDSDVLTPTGKMKRRVIHQRYSALIDAMYSDPRDASSMVVGAVQEGS